MPLTFAATSIAGTWEAPVAQAPEHHAITTKYVGLHGESELDGGIAGREISVRIVLHNRHATMEKLAEQLRTLDRMVGKHGALRCSNLTTRFLRKFAGCTFRGFTPDGEAEGRSGPLKDDGGHLKDEAGRPDGGWWIRGTLRWRQLQV